MVLDHDPGWRLARPSVLARRYDASVTGVEDALQELIRRGLLRRLPDGHLRRASPAEYLITLNAIAGLGTCVDPMGASITCASTHISSRPVPEDIGLMLGLPPRGQATTVRRLWTADGDRAAMTTTYARGWPDADATPTGQYPVGRDLNSLPGAAEILGVRHAVVPAAVQVEIQPPAPAVVRYLRLPPGIPAAEVAVRFDDQETGSPVAMTTAFLRCDLFRIVIGASAAPAPLPPQNGIGSWAPDAQEREP